MINIIGSILFASLVLVAVYYGWYVWEEGDWAKPSKMGRGGK